MSRGLSQATIVGNLTRDPERRDTSTGTVVCDMSVAVNGYNDEVSYFDVTAFGKLAENCASILKRGASVVVSGRLRQRRWEAKDGTKRSTIEIVANDVVFPPRLTEAKVHARPDLTEPDWDDDSIPF